MKRATVIIPTYNERGIIAKTVEALSKVFTHIEDWEMTALVVDDTSPDKTYELVEQLQDQYSFLHLLVNKDKAGLGAAYLKGMDYAFDELEADVVFEFDADLSHDPSKIPQMLAKIDEGYQLVIGSRYIAGGSIPDDWGLHRKFLSVVGNLVIKLILTNFSVADWTTGYRAITKKVYQQISSEMRDQRFSGYTFQVGFLHKALKNNVKITEIPFHFKDRTVGKSKIGPEFIINNLIYLLKVRMKEILESRIFKFVIVGGTSAFTQIVMEQLLIHLIKLSYLPAHIIAIELAVMLNFALSNMWTFADRKLKRNQLLPKFIQFNLSSGGSILIQIIIGALGSRFIGIFPLFQLPIVNLTIDTGMFITAAGILIGMFWNFFAYNFFIWKKKDRK
jgi:dolichol-phosphate mannosyltransferase